MRLAAAIIKFCALLIMAACIVVPTQAWAKSSINKNLRGLALQGYDPVAYFTLNRPVKSLLDSEGIVYMKLWNRLIFVG